MRFLHKFTLLFSAVVIIGSIVQFIVFDRFFLSAADLLLLETNERAAKNLSDQFLTHFQKIENTLKVIAADETTRKNHGFLTTINDIIPEIDAIAVVDKQGKILLSSGNESDVSNFNLSQRTYFQEAMKGQNYVSDVYTGSLGNQIIAVAVPVWENDSVTGVIVGVIRLRGDILAVMYDNKFFGRNGTISIIDKHQNIVYHPNKELIGEKSITAESFEEISGSVIMKNRTDEEQYIGYSKVPGLDWIVSVNTPTAEVTKFRRILVYEMIAISFLSIFFILLIGSYTVRHFMKPIDQLLDGFASMKKGKYKQIPIEQHTSEFTEIIQIYNDGIKKLEEVHNRLEGAAVLDGLTGILNRRAFEKEIKTAFLRINDGALKNIGILVLDLDNFKILNDTQGHLIGDEVLKEFAVILKNNVEQESVFRFGGDEFVIILQNTSEETSLSVAEEIRLQSEKNLRGCTVSIGIAIYPNHTEIIEELLRLADKALYISKKSKNKVTIYSNPL
ncbi:sensor domain-containing diguanylate cyclase [Anaerosinus massiliensis]|uniref:sensor domain-containing diguanylate cyclase n=1 Tax=Massilibacillus massiliensis TaxID=1806837 RepID=UPI000AA42061|nr:sensor domain-containing diguanylate cyclase [Massilibacillus massiliensis]